MTARLCPHLGGVRAQAPLSSPAACCSRCVFTGLALQTGCDRVAGQSSEERAFETARQESWAGKAAYVEAAAPVRGTADENRLF